MNPILKNILAVLAGLVVGNIVNGGIVFASLITHPELKGIDMQDSEAFARVMEGFGPVDYIIPFLAHALGTLTGAFVAAKIAATSKMVMAMIIGVFFLIAGIWNIMTLPYPTSMIVVDLLLAYFPMAWLGGKLGSR